MPPFNLRSRAWPYPLGLARFPDPKSCFSQRVSKEGPRPVWARARSAEGDPKAMVAAEISAMATGGYASAQCEVITTPEDFLDEAQRAADLTAAFDAPNRDEIDRMLMEE